MGIALQLLFTGLGIGSIYALVALGFVLIYRATKRGKFRSGRLRHAPGFSVGPIFFDSQYLLILGVTVVMVTLQHCFFERTLLGKKMQATSQDKEMASLLGIPVALMIMLTFMYSSALGALAGILVAPGLFVSVGLGSSIALKAFAASLIGGGVW